jgi:hypothetical protein
MLALIACTPPLTDEEREMQRWGRSAALVVDRARACVVAQNALDAARPNFNEDQLAQLREAHARLEEALAAHDRVTNDEPYVSGQP